jgi:hypothetical protein
MAEGPLTFARQDSGAHLAFSLVRDVANELAAYMALPEVVGQLAGAHSLGASSHDIQDILLPKATEMGFASERNGLFSQYRSSRIRPDYYMPVLDTGILMEVERGKILANNMDLLDVWKCHICREADYLFLVFPRVRQTGNGRNEAILERAANRVAAFFEPGNEINVQAAFLFPY